MARADLLLGKQEWGFERSRQSEAWLLPLCPSEPVMQHQGTRRHVMSMRLHMAFKSCSGRTRSIRLQPKVYQAG